jgi:SEC-C motif
VSAQDALAAHCTGRKYAQRANRWFGLVLRPEGSLWFGLKLEFPWVQDTGMDELTHGWPKGTIRPPDGIRTRSARKISRNAPCPCGSGKKYKKCCMVR